MFMTTVGQPHYDPHCKQYFEGKFGVWPFIEMLTQNIKAKTEQGEEWRPNLSHLSPRTLSKRWWLESFSGNSQKDASPPQNAPVYVQQDKTKPHTACSDSILLNEGCPDGLNILITNQPLNSLDLNVIDLEFFNAIQSFQHKQAPSNVKELISMVTGA